MAGRWLAAQGMDSNLPSALYALFFVLFQLCLRVANRITYECEAGAVYSIAFINSVL